MVEIIIRLAAPADADVIGQLWEQLVAYHHALDPALPPAAQGGGRRYARRIFDRINDPLTRVLIAEVKHDDGQIEIAGYLLGVIVDFIPEMFAQETTGFLADIFVVEAYRRHGVGRKLVAALIDWFKERGVSAFEWHVSARNPAGIAFWKAVGGREVMLRMRADLGT